MGTSFAGDQVPRGNPGLVCRFGRVYDTIIVKRSVNNFLLQQQTFSGVGIYNFQAAMLRVLLDPLDIRPCPVDAADPFKGFTFHG